MNFDGLARHYDWMEKVTAGSRLQRMRTHWLEKLAGRRNILSAGEGHGRFAAACVARYPQARMTCVEGSGAMIAKAKARPGLQSANVTWVQADVLNWTYQEKYDAVVTCFFLDCFPEETLSRIVAKLSDAAADEAIWLVVDFAVPTSGWARWRALFVHALMYRFFRLATKLPAKRLVPPDAFLEAQGFKRVDRVETEWGLLRADVWRRKVLP
ncbi:MAG: methyltransferase domain-containing protein [Nibricoccus sp.]